MDLRELMDLDGEREGEAFTVPDSWTTSMPDLEAFLAQHSLFQGVDFDLPAIQLDNPYGLSKDFALGTALIDLDGFEYGALPRLDDIPEGSIASLSSDDQHSALASQDDIQDDIWQLANDLGPLKNDIKLLTWESFFNPSYSELGPAFLSEAGPAAFDAALQVRAAEAKEDFKAGRVLQSNPLLRSLWHLGLGRASVLFRYDAEQRQFVQAIDDGRMSGYSLASSQSITSEILHMGNTMAGLRAFAEDTYASPVAYPGLVALASAVRVVCEAIEDHLVHGFGSVQSLLQLQALFKIPVEFLSIIQDLVDDAGSVASNEEITSLVFRKTLQHDYSGHVHELMSHLLARISQPFFDTLEEWIGLRQRQDGTPLPQFRQEEQEDDSLVESHGSQTKDTFPDFILEGDRHLVIESHKCLAFMHDNNPEHPVCNMNTQRDDTANLAWAFGWSDIQRVACKAAEHETRLRSAIAEYDRGEPNGVISPATGVRIQDRSLNCYSGSDLAISEQLNASVLTLNDMKSLSSQCLPDELFSVITEFLHQSDMEPDHTQLFSTSLSLVPHLSLHPLFSVQHRLLTTACLRSVILDHSLRTYLDLVRSFQLCASGPFTSRLVEVLFSPEFESVERQRGTLRSGGTGMGLKLGSGERREWPPASSELTLALRGVLSETWKTSFREAKPHNQSLGVSGRRSTLPGGLSFALRVNLSQHEIDRILDPHSVYALDFLRLSYEPPRALAAIFTPRSLDMYDRVFRLLLRTLRLEFVMAQSFRDTLVLGRQRKRFLRRRTEEEGEEETLVQRFRHDAGHFVSTLTAYFIHTAVGKPWHRFREYFDALEQHVKGVALGGEQGLDNRNDTHARTPAFSLAALTAMHESTLSTITTSLLLRKRQRKAADLLENVCNEILAFAKSVRERSMQPGTDSGDSDRVVAELRQLYEGFTRRVSEFTATCRRLGENHKDGVRDQGAEAIRELVETLQELGNSTWGGR